MHDDDLYAKQGQADELQKEWEAYDDDVYIPEEYRSKKAHDVLLQQFGSVAGTDGNGDLIIAVTLIATLIGILIGGSL